MGLLDGIDIDKILGIVEKLLALCKGSREESVIDEIRNPGWLTRRRFERALRQEGMTLTPQQTEAVYQLAATAKQIELEQLVRAAWGAF